MELLHEARVGVQPLERFRRIVGPGRLKEALAIGGTAGLARSVRAADAHVIWRCHIGRDGPDEHARQGWEFLCPHRAGIR